MAGEEELKPHDGSDGEGDGTLKQAAIKVEAGHDSLGGLRRTFVHDGRIEREDGFDGSARQEWFGVHERQRSSSNCSDWISGKSQGTSEGVFKASHRAMEGKSAR